MIVDHYLVFNNQHATNKESEIIEKQIKFNTNRRKYVSAKSTCLMGCVQMVQWSELFHKDRCLIHLCKLTKKEECY